MSQNIVDLGGDEEVKLFPCGSMDFRTKSTINGEPGYRYVLYPEQGQTLRAALNKEADHLRARLAQAERLAEALRETMDHIYIGDIEEADAVWRKSHAILTAWEAGKEQSNG